MRRAAPLLALLLAVPVVAQVRPQPGPGDPRLQVVTYDPDQVVQLQVASGYQLSVEFAPDERVESIAVGDPGNWTVTPNRRGDHLFVKPNGGGSPTNMTVVTDARTYEFELVGGAGGGAFAVRFLYPAVSGGTAASAIATPSAAMVGRYHLSGDARLRPSAMADDGVHTTIEWPTGRTLPAIFAVDGNGVETLVNGAMRDGQYVVDATFDHYLFRLNHAVAYARRIPRLPRR